MSLAGVRPISAIGIVTADRPRSLRRTIDSLTKATAGRSARPRLLLVDGSRTSAGASGTRACAHEARAAGWNVHHVDAGAARRLRGALKVPKHLAGALSPGTTGANRNLVLLMTAGEQVLFVDDDVVADLWVHPARRNGLQITGHDDRREFSFHRSRAAALAVAAANGADLLGAHERLLGRDLTTLIGSRMPDRVAACAHIRSAFADRRPLVVRTTSTGLAGDAGRSCPRRLLLSGGSLRGALWTSAAAFRAAMTCREERRIARIDYVSHAANTPTTCLGVANGTMTPPFMPRGRNEDGVFGAALSACDLSSVFGHLSVGVRHESSRPAEYAPREVRSARESRVAELLIAIIRQYAPAVTSAAPESRLAAIGRAIQEIGSMALPDLIWATMVIQRTARLRQLDLAEQASTTKACPSYWRRALAEHRREFESHADRAGFWLPVEFRRASSHDAGYRQLARFLRQTGQLFTAWPSLHREACALGAGIGLSKSG